MIDTKMILTLLALLNVGCGNDSQKSASLLSPSQNLQKNEQPTIEQTAIEQTAKKDISPINATSLQDYIAQLEAQNHISYEKIQNSRGIYVTSMCYTKTKDSQTSKTFNPCYSCHTKGKEPNYYNDANLQEEYNFPQEIQKNPFSNLFKDRSAKVAQMDDESILYYVRQSNYFDDNGNIILASSLPKQWQGYRPDCYYHFDDEGFDTDPDGNYTLWRAFRYYPFLGTFWPTNGSTDDVLIRLDTRFTEDNNGTFDKDIYKLNLSIVEALVKQKDIMLKEAVDEQLYDVDLNRDGKLSKTNVISWQVKSYIGKAKQALEDNKLHLAPGLFPENTEFLHSVRYIDWDENHNLVKLSARMKELRYAKKYSWRTYSEIERAADAELWELNSKDSAQATISTFRGNYQQGLKNEIGWVYQGFIEDIKGALRPQTHEETIGCMGCHSHLGATTDSTFAFARKFEGQDKEGQSYGWNHWSQKGLSYIPEPKVNYKNYGQQYEYSFYLQNNHSGNEFRDNEEVKEKFFMADGSVKPIMIEKLHKDISLLLFPSKSRALALDKGYKAMVEEQSYIYGRDANVKAMENVYKERKEEDITGIKTPIIR